MEIGKFVKQYKGKDLGKVPKSKLENNDWHVGIKYDGNYMQIHKKGNKIWFFTSSGEEMYIKELADDLLTLESSFIIEAEFNNNSDGLTLNDRRKSSTGTPRADFKKEIVTSMPNSQLRIFDVLYLRKDGEAHIIGHEEFEERLHFLIKFPCMSRVKTVNFTGPYTLDYCKQFAQRLIKEGSEGAFAYHSTHTIKDKGRSNLAIKLKADNKRTMVCVGATESDTVDGEWGALLLRDDNGLVQAFGGLTDKIRRMHPYSPTGEFEVRYESFTDGKYIQGFING